MCSRRGLATVLRGSLRNPLLGIRRLCSPLHRATLSLSIQTSASHPDVLRKSDAVGESGIQPGAVAADPQHLSPITRPGSEFLQYLLQKIKATGPLTVAEYMKECLVNPLYGYYSRQNPIGRHGDFITAPEVCQIFGELLALWCVNEWNMTGRVTPLQVVELGPGSGVLAWDMLRIISSFPMLRGQVSLKLVERSMELASIQARKLGVDCQSGTSETDLFYQTGTSSFGIPVSWYQHIEDVPHEQSYIIANEFFDALPVHKFQRTDKGLREILVDMSEDRERLRFVMAPQETLAIRLAPSSCIDRNHIELSPEALIMMQNIAQRVSRDGGGALIIDYGHDGTKGDTIRGFRRHEVVDPLLDPGATDLTADVDFSILKSVLTKHTAALGPIPQYQFLSNLAFEQRFDALIRACKSENERNRLAAACDLLINPEKMGGQFFVLAVVCAKRLSLSPVTGYS